MRLFYFFLSLFFVWVVFGHLFGWDLISYSLILLSLRICTRFVLDRVTTQNTDICHKQLSINLTDRNTKYPLLYPSAGMFSFRVLINLMSQTFTDDTEQTRPDPTNVLRPSNVTYLRNCVSSLCSPLLVTWNEPFCSMIKLGTHSCRQQTICTCLQRPELINCGNNVPVIGVRTLMSRGNSIHVNLYTASFSFI